jgi:hypothetical protein
MTAAQIIAIPSIPASDFFISNTPPNNNFLINHYGFDLKEIFLRNELLLVIEV